MLSRRQRSSGGLHISKVVTLPPAFLISHQSVPKSRLVTAMNCCVIAPGNHWIMDSLRGAPPPGEAICADAQVEPSFIYHYDFRRGQCRPPYGIGKAHPFRGALVLVLSIYALCAFDIFAFANSIYRPAIRYAINPPRPAGHIERLRISKAEPISKIHLGIYIDF